MAESESQSVDPTKLDYLGRGVDCREPKEKWLDRLDDYGADKIRDLALNNENINKPNFVKKNKTESTDETTDSKKGAEGHVKVKPHESLKLGGELKVKHDTSKTTRNKTGSQTTKIVTMRGDTSKDPLIIKRDHDRPTHYTKYETELSQFILEHIDEKQKEANHEKVDVASSPREPGDEAKEDAKEDAICLGKMIKDLEGEDSVAKLEDYLQHARAIKELGQQIWQVIANGCFFFMDKKKPYTHYVSSITLGAHKQESYKSQDSSRDTSGGVQGNAMEFVDAALQGESKVDNRRTVTRTQSRGESDDSGAVTAEEIIEASMKPVTTLINEKSKELKKIMEALLDSYSHANQGDQQGPLYISCRKQLSFGREHEIYWQVNNDEIYGTTTASETSAFYVQRIGEQFCKIIYETPRFRTKKFITVQRPFDAHCPLKLVESADQQDICFTLMNATKEPVDVPATPDTWKSNSPFFIKLPMGSLSMGLMIMRPTRYVSIKKRDEVKQTTDSHSADATAKTPPKYTTASCATTDMGSNLLQFYFTPLVKLQKGHVALGGPPPPPSQIESDSSSAVQLQRQEDDIKQAFIELVGREYVFPLQVKAEDVPGAESQ